MTWSPRRRTFLRTSIGVAAAAGLAGCSNGGSETTEPDGQGNEADTTTRQTSVAVTETGTTAVETEPPTPTKTEQGTFTRTPPAEEQRTPYENPRDAINKWLKATDDYDGGIDDRTGTGEVPVQVGATGNGGNFAFDPVAIRIATGTKVSWRWTGKGGRHNVAAKSGVFSSGTPVEGGGVIFNRTFECPGLYLYECSIHSDFGMRGAIIVSEPSTLSGYPRVDSWLEGRNYDGTLADRRNQISTKVEVGTEGNGGFFSFGPAAALVSPGTQVNFDWTGRGGSHSIEWADENDIAGYSTPEEVADSEGTGSAAHSYTVTLSEPGVYLYKCGEHPTKPGRGAIVVNDPNATSNC